MTQTSDPAHKRKLTSDEFGILVFLFALILGTLFRILLPLAAQFPINDGALFYRMIEAVQNNNFKLPVYIDYNGLLIPFAYPPLGFYVAGFIGVWFQIPTLQIVLWMPAIILCITLPFVFLLAKSILKSTMQAGVATLLYALLPRALTWMIMGGGVTRSLGNLFLILATLYIYKVFVVTKPKNIAGAILFSGLVCLTHPEAVVHTVLTAALLYIFFGMNKKGTRDGLLIGIGTIIITSPWWLTILTRFGVSPFWAAGQTGFHSVFSWLNIFNAFSEEPLHTIIGVFAILGIIIQVAKKQYYLPIWYIAPFIVEPRNAPNVAILPMVLLASICITELIVPEITRIEALFNNQSKMSRPNRTVKIFYLYLVSALIIGMLAFETDLFNKRLSKGLQASYEWVQENTDQTAQFLILTGDTGIFTDYANEWFPVLAERRSLTTIQGYEWVSDVDFSGKMEVLAKLQSCTDDIKPVECIESQTYSNSLNFDYILVTKDGIKTGALLSSLFNSDNYNVFYESYEIIIFAARE